MRIFIDTEFIEGKQRKKFLGFNVGYTKPTIDLISIALVTERNGEFFALNSEFNLDEAWNRFQWGEDGEGKEVKIYWLRENVLLPIYRKYIVGDLRNKLNFNKRTMRFIMDNWGQSLESIAYDIQEFIEDESVNHITKPKFFGYYSDYDWVVFCWIFGIMNELPEEFPKLCYDLKQIFDEKLIKLKLNKEEVYKMENYPQQLNEHDCLEDAKWNMKFYEFLKTLK